LIGQDRRGAIIMRAKLSRTQLMRRLVHTTYAAPCQRSAMCHWHGALCGCPSHSAPPVGAWSRCARIGPLVARRRQLRYRAVDVAVGMDAALAMRRCAAGGLLSARYLDGRFQGAALFNTVVRKDQNVGWPTAVSRHVQTA
jgi:hypothetical protein